MKPDVIMCWPKNCDYPMWRLFMWENRERFNKIFIVFTDSDREVDYRKFLRKYLNDESVRFIDSP